jgi:tRNA-splicing ligase RtcB
MSNYIVLNDSKSPVKAWVNGVQLEEEAKKQLLAVANLPFIHKWVAVMPDVHAGIGATVGSVVPTYGAIIPAAVGVDIGCGMVACRTTLTASDLPDSLKEIRSAIEAAVPHGRTDNGGANDRGAWGDAPELVRDTWADLDAGFRAIVEKHPRASSRAQMSQLGTLGTGNHFIEVCLDEEQRVWLMLHSGSRGVGNRIGSYFIELAKKEMERFFINLPDTNLAYLPDGTEYFKDYVQAVSWAQNYAMLNREIMMQNTISAIKKTKLLPKFMADEVVVNCHHNYVEKEHHFGKDVWVTRKGAVRARKNDLGIIPGSMGAKSFIVRGKGNNDSFHSCSHGAGRAMSRTEAKKRFTLKDHREATEGVECRKDSEVIDETPMAYKSIDAVMAAQSDLVDIVHTLKQVVCVKG